MDCVGRGKWGIVGTRRGRHEHQLFGRALLAATALGALATAPVLAQTATWTGAVDDDWSNAGNWQGGLEPDASTSVSIAGTREPVIDNGLAAAGFTTEIGTNGSGGLSIEDGSLSAYHMTLGSNGQGVVTVTGSTSSLSVDAGIRMGGGAAGSSGELRILAGGHATTNQVTIGAEPGTSGTVIVDGDGSVLETRITGGIFAGYEGEGDITVSGGGTVFTEATHLGYFNGSTGTMTITGEGSSWIDGGDVYVGGLYGGTGRLEVLDGGYLQVQQSLFAGYGGDGEVTIDGAGTVAEVWGAINVFSAAGGELTISNGAVVSSQWGSIGTASGTSGTVTVSGLGTQWTTGPGLDLGLEGDGALTVTDGAYVSATEIYLGSRDGGVGTLVVSGDGYVDATYVMMAQEPDATGRLRLESDGVLQAAQVQRYDGDGTVTFDGGTLRLRENQSYLFDGFVTGDITLEDDGGTIDTNGYRIETDRAFVGAGGLTKTGAGTLSFWTDRNTYSGTTRIEHGTLRGRSSNVLSSASTHDIGADGTLRLDANQEIGALAGAGSVNLSSRVLTVGLNDANADFAGVISGTGALVKSGSGVQTLSGTNTYSGGTSITNGTLDLGTINRAGSIVGAITVGSDGGLTLTRAQLGSGSVENEGSIWVRNGSSLGSADIHNEGSIFVRHSGSAGTSSIDNEGDLYFLENSSAGRTGITNSGTVSFEGHSTADDSDILNQALLAFLDDTTAGTTRLNNSGYLDFWTYATAGSATIDSSGRIVFHEDATAGSAAFDLTDGDVLFQGRSSGGSARFDLAAGTAFDISGLSSGGMEVGSIDGAGTVYLGSNTLAIGGNDRSMTISGNVVDGGDAAGTGGGLIKVGAGTLTLSGTNSFTGPMSVRGGKISVSGSLAAALDVASGGRVGGNGSYASVSVGNGGILSPGNSIGAVTVGTLTMGAGSIYEVELKEGGNTPGIHNDTVRITGTATIDAGASIRVLAENGTDDGTTYVPGTDYTIIRTDVPGNLVVNAAPSITDSFAYLDFTGRSDGQSYSLTSRLTASSFCLATSTANQCAAGDAVYALGSSSPAYAIFQGLSDTEAPAALDAVTGEAHASMRHVLDGTFAALDVALRQRRGGEGAGAAPQAPLGYAASSGSAGTLAIDAVTAASPARAWIAGLGGGGAVGANSNAGRLDWSAGGLVAGYETDLALAGGTGLGGVAIGYARSQGLVPTRGTSSLADSLMLAGYGALTDGATSLGGTLTAGASHLSTDRTISVGGTSHIAHADYWAPSIQLTAEAAHAFDLGNGTRLAPVGTLAAGWTGHGGFTETGPSPFNLTAAPGGDLRVQAGVGLEVSQLIETETGNITFVGRALWEHAILGADPTQSFSFAGGTVPFTVTGAPADKDWLRLGLAVRHQGSDGLSIAAGYDGEFSATRQSHRGDASLGRTF